MKIEINIIHKFKENLEIQFNLERSVFRKLMNKKVFIEIFKKGQKFFKISYVSIKAIERNTKYNFINYISL